MYETSHKEQRRWSIEPYSSFFKERYPVDGSLSISGDSKDLSNKLQMRDPAGRGSLSLQKVAPCSAGRGPVPAAHRVYTVSEAATDRANLPSSGTAAVPSSVTQRKVCLGSAPTGATRAGEPGQGGTRRGEQQTAQLPALPLPQQPES